MEKLPSELASMIAVDLDVSSVAALRQTSRFNCRQFTPIFLQFFKNQSTDLTKEGLQRLYRLACSPVLRTAITTLTLDCLYYHYDLCNYGIHICAPQCPSIRDPQFPCGCKIRREWVMERQTEQELFKGEEMFNMLSFCFENFSNLRIVNLEASVVLDVNIKQRPEEVPSMHWRELWTNAIHSYRILVLSIAEAGICLDSLNIYQRTRKCSIPTHEVFEPALFSDIQRANFTSFATCLKTFSISLATTTLPIRPRQGAPYTSGKRKQLSTYDSFDISRGTNLHADDHRVDSLADLDDVSRLLHMMPSLESLHIHLCTTVNGILSPAYYQKFLATLFSHGWHFPMLSHLVLRGFRTSQDDLYDVLERHVSQLRTLSLENITLSTGSWTPVFSLLSRDARLLEKLRLSALWSPESHGNRMNLAHAHRVFNTNGLCTPSDNGDADNVEISWYVWELAGEDVRRSGGIQFRPMMGYMGESADSDATTNWYGQYCADYGPF
ncbi:hypothetical protein SCAR479_11275 [Seiridium cardinale]|uniref:F-box domain-containing protein n=1 Tax=Seiridium cardinale TaxID=138064 RepID=A0ABR2XEF1_9PEZI